MKLLFFVLPVVVLVAVTALPAASSQQDITTLLRSGIDAYNQHNYDKALSNFNEILKIDPNNMAAKGYRYFILSQVYRQTPAGPTQDIFFTYLQIEVRNQYGQLVGYLETDKIQVKDANLLNAILDKTTQGKSIIVGKNQNFTQYKIVTKSDNVSKKTVISRTGIFYNQKWIIYGIHDGVSLARGDKFTATLTIIRPA